MPKEIKDVKQFLTKMIDQKASKKSGDKAGEEGKKRPESCFEKTLTVKNNQDNVKFKLRTKNCLYTFKTKDREMAQKMLKNLPPGLKKTEVRNSAKKIKK